MKKPRGTKASNMIERLYKEGKCRDCSVVVTRMDFAKILGKFTKVKIQYESSSTPNKEKDRGSNEVTSPNTNSRLKNNENGMVLIHRNAYKPHPVKQILTPKRQENQVKSNNLTTRQKALINNNNNILKENNRIKKVPILKENNVGIKKQNSKNLKRYGIMFTNPVIISRNECSEKLTLLDLLPNIDALILPSDDWSIEYLPNAEEPKEKVYDRIAAELEDLMYNEKVVKSSEKSEGEEIKSEDFPSILDILNDSTSKPVENSNTIEKNDLAASDVEAMLLDESNTNKAMDISDTSVGNLIEDVSQLNAIQPVEKSEAEIENPGSPSILDETLKKGIAEQLPDKSNDEIIPKEPNQDQTLVTKIEPMETDTTSEAINDSKLDTKIEIDVKGPAREITHLVFKKIKNGICFKCVTCPKSLKYRIEFDGKPIELLGAPKYITSREDLQVLLQIVDESELQSFYILQ